VTFGAEGVRFLTGKMHASDNLKKTPLVVAQQGMYMNDLNAKLIRFVVCCLMIVLNLSASDIMANEGSYQYTTQQGQATITGYSGTGGSIIIPSQLGGNPVTIIGSHAFLGNDSLTHVVIPDTVTTIDLGAFAFCSNLQVVLLGNSLVSIMERAFSDNTSLASIVIPASVTYIGSSAFLGCSGLQSFFVMPGNAMFSSVDGVLYYDQQSVLHQYPSSKTNTTYEVPVTVSSLRAQAFQNSLWLRSISVASGNTAYRSQNGVLFDYNMSNLIWYPLDREAHSYQVPPSVTQIGSNAFDGARHLRRVKIGNGVSHIGYHSFANAQSLRTVLIEGPSPGGNDNRLFFRSPHAKVYRRSASSGWGMTFGLAQVHIVPEFLASNVVGTELALDIAARQGDLITIEWRERLGDGNWTYAGTIQSGSGDMARFLIQNWKNYPSRFYRASIP